MGGTDPTGKKKDTINISINPWLDTSSNEKPKKTTSNEELGKKKLPKNTSPTAEVAGSIAKQTTVCERIEVSADGVAEAHRGRRAATIATTATAARRKPYSHRL